MFFLRLNEKQLAALRPHVKGKKLHDLGAGDLAQARILARLGATLVVAVDKEYLVPHTTSKRIQYVRAYFDKYEAADIDNAFLSWPPNTTAYGLVGLVRQAKTIIYIGKNTDLTMCGDRKLWEYLITREVLEYVPDRRNTLIIYGSVLDKPRELKGEERGALEGAVIPLYYDAVEHEEQGIASIQVQGQP